MYNEKQIKYFKEQGSQKLKERKAKEKEAMAFKFFIESEQYKLVKAEVMELVAKSEEFEPTQEGAIKALCRNNYINGLKEFFAIAERKAR